MYDMLVAVRRDQKKSGLAVKRVVVSLKKIYVILEKSVVSNAVMQEEYLIYLPV